jgi:hypothetical protein
VPVTLAEAQQNAQDDLSVSVIDEFRGNAILDLLTFDDCVSPTGGGTLTYAYRRLATRSGAGFRALNSEYVPTEVTTAPVSVDLKPLGGSFQVDRVIGRVGPALSGAVSLNMSQKIKSARDTFGDAVINGDSAADANSFEGLNRILDGTGQEINGAGFDWSGLDEAKSQALIDTLDEFLSNVDGGASVIAGNRRILALVRSAARRVGYYDRSPGAAGSTVETYAGIPLYDTGFRVNNTDVIPVSGGTTDLYALRLGMDAVHGVSMAGSPLVQQWLPDFSTAGAVKTGEVEMGPVAIAVKASKSAAVLRGVRVSAA